MSIFDESHEDGDGPVFIFQEDAEAQHSTAQLKNLSIGESFIFMGKKFTKRNEMGWGMGICNIADAQGNISHLHPTTRIQLLQ